MSSSRRIPTAALTAALLAAVFTGSTHHAVAPSTKPAAGAGWDATPGTRILAGAGWDVVTTASGAGWD